MFSPPLRKEGQEEIEIKWGIALPPSQKGGTGGDREKYGAMLSSPLRKEGQEETEINIGQCSPPLSERRDRGRQREIWDNALLSSQKGGTGGDKDKYGAMLSSPLRKEGRDEIEINMGQSSPLLSERRDRGRQR